VGGRSSPVKPLSSWTQLGLTGLIGLLAALLFVWLETPLPWMLGPLLVIATLRMMGVPLWSANWVRYGAHWIIGTALGVYFTPAVVAQMAALWIPILLGMAFALALSLTFAWLLRRTGMSWATAFFAGGIGGASEMVLQSERAGGDVPVIIAVHTVRVMIVVVLLPFVFRAFDIQGSESFTPARLDVNWPGLVLILVAGMVVIAPLHWLKAPSAWMLGSLFATALLTVAQIAPSALPDWLLKAGQLAIGMSLGSRFSPETIAQVRRILPMLVATTLAGIGLAVAFGFALTPLTGQPVSTMALATSPGGIAEMSLTARVLGLGVPVVTVFHVSRLVFMLLVYGAVYRWLVKRFDLRDD
jgi:membrane AbrB-like protein